MQGQSFKLISNKISKEFKNILINNCYTTFDVVADDNINGQIFVLEVFYGEEYVSSDDKVIENVDIVRPILEFQCSGEWKNSAFDINNFFRINDEVMSEFYELGARKELDSLITALKEGKALSKPKSIGQAYVNTYFFLSISSKVVGTDKFLADLLQERIATIGLSSDEKIEVDCLQCERKEITISEGELAVELSVPFDKVSNFQIPYNENKPMFVDEKYVFIVMSFQSDPLLQDAYEAIKRTTGKLKKGLKCERVDEIQDDFTITDKITDCIKKAGLIIVDLTGNRPNVYYELGYARALGKKIILLAKEGEKPHFDVSTQNIIFYKNVSTLEQGLNKRLRAIFNK